MNKLILIQYSNQVFCIRDIIDRNPNSDLCLVGYGFWSKSGSKIDKDTDPALTAIYVDPDPLNVHCVILIFFLG